MILTTECETRFGYFHFSGYVSRQHDSTLDCRLESLELTSLLEGGEWLVRSFDGSTHTHSHDSSTGQGQPQRLHLRYEVCKDTSPAYKGISTMLTIQHSNLFVDLDRPAVSSLIQVRA